MTISDRDPRRVTLEDALDAGHDGRIRSAIEALIGDDDPWVVARAEEVWESGAAGSQASALRLLYVALPRRRETLAHLAMGRMTANIGFASALVRWLVYSLEVHQRALLTGVITHPFAIAEGLLAILQTGADIPSAVASASEALKAGTLDRGTSDQVRLLLKQLASTLSPKFVMGSFTGYQRRKEVSGEHFEQVWEQASEGCYLPSSPLGHVESPQVLAIATQPGVLDAATVRT